MLKQVVRTGKVVIGFRQTLKLIKLGKVKYVVMASNTPDDMKQDVEYYSRLSGVKVIRFPGTNKELGTTVGKPFSVSVMGIADSGQISVEILDRFIELVT